MMWHTCTHLLGSFPAPQPFLPLSLCRLPPLGHLGPLPVETTCVPTCPLLWPRQRVLQQGLEDLRHVHSRGHSNLVAARHGPAGGACSGEFGSSWRGRGWLGSHRLGRQAGCEPEAANGQPQPQPACPPPARPPASSGCSQAFPSRCLAGRAWPRASGSTWSHGANPLTENLACYLTSAKGSSPPVWEP